MKRSPSPKQNHWQGIRVENFPIAGNPAIGFLALGAAACFVILSVLDNYDDGEPWVKAVKILAKAYSSIALGVMTIWSFGERAGERLQGFVWLGFGTLSRQAEGTLHNSEHLKLGREEPIRYLNDHGTPFITLQNLVGLSIGLRVPPQFFFHWSVQTMQTSNPIPLSPPNDCCS